MLFNSLEFLLFLPTIFVLYWFVFKNQLRAQNILLLLASYVFYGWWDWRFLSLILLSTGIDYFVGLQLFKTTQISKRKWLLGISLFANLGMLVFFKYFNFFIQSWVDAWAGLGISMQSTTLQIILPVGISFYTFQTLSYTIDIYRKQITPSKSIIDFAAFVSFFPQLVAGPIERASNLLPQFYKKRIFSSEQATSGLFLFLWGLFKKVVIADSCAVYTNAIFSNYSQMNSLSLILGGIYFSFQIYGDFSGYSDMAIGTSRFFGFDLMRNFRYPYFSRDIAEFWRRWHISLSTWFRDYIFIPLGGSKGNKYQQIKNVFIVFLVSGFWHGANWTFIIWGGINALYYIPLLLLNKNKSNIGDITSDGFYNNVKTFLKVAGTFCLISFSWIFFRSENIYNALGYISRIFNENDFAMQFIRGGRYSVELIPIIIIFLIIEWFSRFKEDPISGEKQVRIIFNLSLVILFILIFGSYSNPEDFIYFQF
jgi:alginate O-acetyltransferase complex protein AlgI